MREGAPESHRGQRTTSCRVRHRPSGQSRPSCRCRWLWTWHLPTWACGCASSAVLRMYVYICTYVHIHTHNVHIYIYISVACEPAQWPSVGRDIWCARASHLGALRGSTPVTREAGTVQRRERLTVGAAGGGGCASTSELTIGQCLAAHVASKVPEWFSDGAARGKEARWILV